jgi:sensor histidine kinase YesM
MFTNKYRYGIILLLAVYSYLNTLFSEVYHYYHIEANGYIVQALFIIITFFVWEGNRIIQYLLPRFFKDTATIKFLVIFFLAGMLFSALISLAAVYFIGHSYLSISLHQLKMPAKLALTYGTRINLFLHILNAIFFYINQYKNKQLEAEELKRISSQAQLQSIKNQVNPHFLFNNLNVLSSLVMQENPDANRFIEEFSKVYRYVLNSQEEELVVLRTELEFINTYNFLLEKRFPESIFIDVKIPPSYQSQFIIPLAVQMLVENAIKHNIVSKANPLHIELEINENAKLVVRNNLQLKPVNEPSTHIGLKNISRRYEMIAGQNIEVIKNEQSFSVLLPLIQRA